MTASAQYRNLFKHSTIRLLQATHGCHYRPFRSPEPFFQGLDAAYTATTISPLPVTKYMTGCRHAQKSHDVVLHIPPSSSSNTSVELLMIELTEHHLMIHILLAPIRRSTDPQAYVHNPNISQIYSSLTTVYSSFSWVQSKSVDAHQYQKASWWQNNGSSGFDFQLNRHHNIQSANISVTQTSGNNHETSDAQPQRRIPFAISGATDKYLKAIFIEL